MIHPSKACRNWSALPARFKRCRAGSHPEPSAPSQRSETGPVSLANGGSTESTMGPFLEWDTFRVSGGPPFTLISSTRSRAGSHFPSWRKQPGWPGSVFS